MLSPFMRNKKKLAKQALQQGDIKKAIELYKQHIEKEKGDLQARRDLANILIEIGSPQEAIWQYQAIAGVYAAAGLLLKSISICKDILELDQSHRETQETLAALYSQKEEHQHHLLQGTLTPRMGAALKDLHPNARSGPPTLPAELNSFLSQDSLHPPSIPSDAIYENQESAEHTFEEINMNSLALEQAEIYLNSQDMSQEILTLSHIPPSELFSNLPPQALTTLITKLNVKRYKAGESILKQNDKGLAFYVIVSGTAKVEKRVGKQQQILNYLGEGDFFGEIALLGRQTRMASVIATSGLEVLELTEKQRLELESNYPKSKKILYKFAQRRLLQNLIRNSIIFSEFPPQMQKEIIRYFKKKDFHVGDTIIQKGEKSKALYIILSGKVEISNTGSLGKVHIESLKEGDFFGEMSLFFKEPTMADVTATTPCQCLRLKSSDFEPFCEKYPAIKQKLLQVSTARMVANERIL